MNYRRGWCALFATTVGLGAAGCGQAPTVPSPAAGSIQAATRTVQEGTALQSDRSIQQFRRRGTDRRGGGRGQRYWWRNRWVDWNPYVVYSGPFDYFQPYYDNYGWYYYGGRRYWGQYSGRGNRRDTDRRGGFGRGGEDGRRDNDGRE